MKYEAKDLTLNNSLKLRSKALNYYEFNSNEQLNSFFKNSFAYDDLSIVGEGTNSIFPSVFHGTVLRSTNESITETPNSDFTIKVGAGCNWDHLVDECVNNKLFGLENLAGIPGSVGAAPIQNIGAYGKELSQFLTEVEVYDLKEKIFKTLSNEECKFGYRTSIFQAHKEFLITSVTLKLKQVFQPYMAYKDLENKKIDSSKEMVELIRTIRDGKLPDRESFPNLGSFFKNPIINKDKFINGIRGMVSYFRGAKQHLYPTVKFDKIVKIPLNDYGVNQHIIARIIEKPLEKLSMGKRYKYD